MCSNPSCAKRESKHNTGRELFQIDNAVCAQPWQTSASQSTAPGAYPLLMPMSLGVCALGSCPGGSFANSTPPRPTPKRAFRGGWAGGRGTAVGTGIAGVISSTPSSLPSPACRAPIHSTNCSMVYGGWVLGRGQPNGWGLPAKAHAGRSHMLAHDPATSRQGTHMLLMCDTSSGIASLAQGCSMMATRSTGMPAGASPGKKRPEPGRPQPGGPPHQSDPHSSCG